MSITPEAMAWLTREQEQNRNSLTYWQRQASSPLQSAKCAERETLAAIHRDIIRAVQAAGE
jgi:hypothetical protein